jgi:hypothetical protein
VKLAAQRLLGGLQVNAEAQLDLLFSEKRGVPVEAKSDVVQVERTTDALEQRHARLWNTD